MFFPSINQLQIAERQARLDARQARGLAAPKPPSKINEELKSISLNENLDLVAIKGLQTKFDTLFGVMSSIIIPADFLSKILPVNDSVNHPDFAFYLNTGRLPPEPISKEALIDKELNESFQIKFDDEHRVGIRIGLDDNIKQELKHAIKFYRYFDLVQKGIENNSRFSVGKFLYILQKFYIMEIHYISKLLKV
jgi:hypothetical protein